MGHFIGQMVGSAQNDEGFVNDDQVSSVVGEPSESPFNPIPLLVLQSYNSLMEYPRADDFPKPTSTVAV
jgi:hypothetical protein